jgi:hypothetical protein
MSAEPEIPESLAPAREEEEALPSLDLVLPKRRLWPFFAVLALIVGVAGFFVWRAFTAPFPTRVLVAIDMNGTWWEGSEAGAEVADRLAGYLEDLGFSPVKAGDPEVEAVLEDAASPEEAAAKLRAAWIITGRIEPVVVKLPLPGAEVERAGTPSTDYYEVRAEGVLEVRHHAERDPLAFIEVRTFSGAQSEERALSLLAGSVARHAANGAVPAMMGHESIEALKNDPKLFDQIAKGKMYATSVELHRAQTEQAYRNLDEKRQKQPGITFSSPVGAEDRLLAVTADGVVVATSDATPFFSPEGQQAVKSSDLETIRLRPFDGGEGKIFWRGYQAFTYPSAPSRGSPIALVENFHGYGRSLSLVEPGREVRRLLVTERRISEPRISPDGQAIAYVEMACRGCPREIVVIDVVAEKEIWRLAAGDVVDAHHAFRWLDARRLLLMFRPAMGKDDDEVPERQLFAVDVTSGERTSLSSLESYLSDPAASPDGRRVALGDPERRSIVVVELEGEEPRRYDVAAIPSALTFSPDGTKIAFEAEIAERRGSEIALLDLASGKTRVLTNDDWPNRFPLFSPDGAKIFFEARNRDPALERRELIRIASLTLR